MVSVCKCAAAIAYAEDIECKFICAQHHNYNVNIGDFVGYKFTRYLTNSEKMIYLDDNGVIK